MIAGFLATQFPDDDEERGRVREELQSVQPIGGMNTPEEVASTICFLGTPALSGRPAWRSRSTGGFVAR